MNSETKMKNNNGDNYNNSSSYSSSTMVSPTPIHENLHDMGPPPFLTKTYDIVEDSTTNHVISWSKLKNSFIVWDPQAFSMTLLPKYFKHKNFSSFVRFEFQGFRKVDPDRWEFANEYFLWGQKHLLKSITRRKYQHPQASHQDMKHYVEIKKFGLKGEIDRLKHDKHILMNELVKLRLQQQNTTSFLKVMEEKVRNTEKKQQEMISFLARAIKCPNFVHQLMEQKDMRREVEEAIKLKRRRITDQKVKDFVIDNIAQCDNDTEKNVKIEPEEFGNIYEYEDTEVDKLTMYLESLCENSSIEKQPIENEIKQYHENIEVDETLWEDLLHGDMRKWEVEADYEVEDNLNILADDLRYLDSSPQ